jgi:hypothetical protein
MLSGKVKNAAAILAAAIALTACGGPDIKQIARDNKFTKGERKALQMCYDYLMGKKPIVTIAGEEKLLSDVPMPVCVCHAKDVASVYKPAKLESYAHFVSWATNANRKPLPKIHWDDTQSQAKNDGAAKRLVASLDSCTNKFVEENKANEEFAELIQPRPERKVKKKKKKESVEEDWSSAE